MTLRAALPILSLAALTSLALADEARVYTPEPLEPLTVSGVLARGVGAQFSNRTRPQNYLGASVGTYIFTGGNARDAFGNAPVSYGAALVQPYRRAGRGPRFDATVLSLNSGGNNLFILGATIGYEVQALKKKDEPSAFARVGVGPAYFSYDANYNNRSVDGRRLGLIGSAEVGYTITRNFIVSARYLQTPSYDGLNFSGLELKLTAALFKL